MNELLELVQLPFDDTWGDRAKAAFDSLFGSPGGRYRTYAGDNKVRTKVDGRSNSSAPFAALIHPSNPDSGGYGGMSFVIFPAREGEGSLVTLTLGTQGLSPDEKILGRPGHARKTNAIAKWLNSRSDETIAWAKSDPVRFDRPVPDVVRSSFSPWSEAFDRYGQEIYFLVRPTDDESILEDAIGAALDLMFEERGEETLSNAKNHARSIRDGYRAEILPELGLGDVAAALDSRRFVILEGPPGTGKTRIALQLLDGRYAGNGRSIQFHPNTTYENVIGGLAPVKNAGGMGFAFEPKAGHLMQAAADARANPEEDFLLHIDEINRADLAKVLGEGVFLLEYRSEKPRQLSLPYDFGQPFHSTLELPRNLHILGTMNSSDRSISILDLAVRRRFGFLKIWPKVAVVEKHGSPLSQDAYHKLLNLFLEYSSDDGFDLMPGHSYFMANSDDEARRRLRSELKPLLEEYLRHGYVAGFSDEIRSYLQYLEGL